MWKQNIYPHYQNPQRSIFSFLQIKVLKSSRENTYLCLVHIPAYCPEQTCDHSVQFCLIIWSQEFVISPQELRAWVFGSYWPSFLSKRFPPWLPGDITLTFSGSVSQQRPLAPNLRKPEALALMTYVQRPVMLKTILPQEHKPSKCEDLWNCVEVAEREARGSVLGIALNEVVVPDETVAPSWVRQPRSQEPLNSTMLGLSRRHFCTKEMENWLFFFSVGLPSCYICCYAL